MQFLVYVAEVGIIYPLVYFNFCFFYIQDFYECSSSFQRSRRHTVGILVGAFPCGIITLFDELYGSESLTQVYAILIEYLAELPKDIRDNIIEICYDDACHLKKFSENEDRASINEVTKFMAGLGKHVDKGGCQY